jgi:hypothetical protein
VYLAFFRSEINSTAYRELDGRCFLVLSKVMSTVHEILGAMDKLTRGELRILKLAVGLCFCWMSIGIGDVFLQRRQQC